MPKEFRVCFKLDRPLPRPIDGEVEGAKVSGERGKDSIFVTHIQAESFEEARDKALSLANKFLDEFCLESDFAARILPMPCWVEDPKGSRFLVVADEAIVLDDEFLLEKRRANGALIERRSSSDPVKIEVDAQDCSRFFRKGRLSEEARDWFDAFRNYFFAIEWISAAHTTSGREKSRLVATLKQCFQDQKALNELRQRATSCEGFTERAGDLYTDVAEFLYHVRCQLSHAKPDDTHKRPFDTTHEAEVKAAVPLARYVARELIKWHRRK